MSHKKYTAKIRTFTPEFLTGKKGEKYSYSEPITAYNINSLLLKIRKDWGLVISPNIPQLKRKLLAPFELEYKKEHTLVIEESEEKEKYKQTSLF